MADEEKWEVWRGVEEVQDDRVEVGDELGCRTCVTSGFGGRGGLAEATLVEGSEGKGIGCSKVDGKRGIEERVIGETVEEEALRFRRAFGGLMRVRMRK